MLLTIMKSKIHRATVTQADLNYVGSLTIDEDLMEAAASCQMKWSICQILATRYG